MSYTPPSGNAIVLALKSGYSPLLGDAVSLALGITGPTASVSGSANVSFSSSGTYDIAFSIPGSASAQFIPRDQDATFDIPAATNTLFINPDRSVLFSGVSSGSFAGQKVMEGYCLSEGAAGFDFCRRTDFVAAGTATVSIVGEQVRGQNLSVNAGASCAFTGRGMRHGTVSIAGQSDGAFHGRFVSPLVMLSPASCAFRSDGSPIAVGAAVFGGKSSASMAALSIAAARVDLASAASVYFEHYSYHVDTPQLPVDLAQIAVMTPRSQSMTATSKQRGLHVFG